MNGYFMRWGIGKIKLIWESKWMKECIKIRIAMKFMKEMDMNEIIGF